MIDYKWKTYNKKKDETNINLVDNKLKLKPMFLKSPILSLSCQHYSEAKILNQNNLVCMICSQKVDVLQLVIDEKFERTTNYI
jgi:SUMO ligase MMS21 Smc5/6 complex component